MSRLCGVVKYVSLEAPESLEDCSLVCKDLRSATEPYLHSCVNLYDEWDPEKDPQPLIKRLLNPQDNIRHHVRHLRLNSARRGPPEGLRRATQINNADVPAPILEDIIRNLAHLRIFSWDVNRDMPYPVLQLLEQQWPSVQLNVENHDRADPDMWLLGSPLLHSLDFGVLNEEVIDGQIMQPPKGMRELSGILLNAPSLQKLNIRFRHNRNSPEVMREFERPGIDLCLPLNASNRLPALQELRFSGQDAMYTFDHSYCQVVSQCMDWGQLRRLDLGLGCSRSFYEIIGPHLTGLMSLRLVIDYEFDAHFYVKCLLTSLRNLQELKLLDFQFSLDEVLSWLPGKTHSLRMLSCHSVATYDVESDDEDEEPYYHDYDSIWHFLKSLYDVNPSLSHLEIDLPLVTGPGGGCPGAWNFRQAEVLARLSRLQKVKVFVDLKRFHSHLDTLFLEPRENSLSEGLNADVARSVSIELFQSFFQNDLDCPLRFLEVCFQHLLLLKPKNWIPKVGEDLRVLPVQNLIRIRRLDRDDAPHPLDGGFTVDSHEDWVRYEEI
ncbi:MAG: hypothetical protein Q9174_005000 [Haloplaca sp. 1 TL-2023]